MRSAIKELSWATLRKELDLISVGAETIDELCGEIKRCGKLVIKLRDDERAIARGAFLTSFLEYAGEAVGLDAASQVCELIYAFMIIDAGYRLIHERLTASPRASRSPQERLSSFLQKTAADYESVRAKMYDYVPRKSNKFFTHFGPIYDIAYDGVPIHSDGMLDDLVESASKVLIMESLANRWFDEAGIARVPRLTVADCDVDPELVTEMRIAATSFRDWNDIEERFRYLGGNLKVITREEMPEYVTDQIKLAIEYEPTKTSLPFEFEMRVAEERQVDKMFTWQMEGGGVTNDVPPLGDVSRGRVLLPPAFVASDEERHALLTL
ncbi:MAG: hypothetical protein M3N13_08135, partial [Candidatus Eremiobacteraeota bacterium]|nr:hypothetical protein [Candidatus Eremiobacteraeota bacterium]